MSSILFRVYMLAILATPLLFSACARKVVYYNPTTYLVRQVTSRAEVENCEYMGIVHARDTSKGRAFSKLRSDAADFGGDHYLVVAEEIEKPPVEWMATTYIIRAESYNCDR